MRTRAVMVLSVLVLLTGCQSWVQWGHDARLTNFESSETTITPANVGSLSPAWTATVAGGDADFVYESISSSMVLVANTSRLVGFSRSGTTGCSGTPKRCSPIWVADTGGRFDGAATVDGNTAYTVTAGTDAANPGRLSAFDLRGTTGCSGTPTTCSPLWTAAASSWSSVTIADGLLFVEDRIDSTLKVFDAAGVQGCSGTPKVCVPRWTSTMLPIQIGTPSVANGKVYVTGEGGLSVFDENGTAGCAGTPAVCAPLWHAAVSGNVRGGASVDASSVYVPVYVKVDGTFAHDTGRLEVFDASGTAGCGGTPKECAPRWTATLAGRVEHTAPALAHGFVYVGDTKGLHAFDAAGSKGCGGVPVVCVPVWSSAADASLTGLFQPVVAGDVVYAKVNGTTAHHRMVAYDATGVNGCSGSPTSCVPLLNVALPGNGVAEGSIIVLDGVVFASSEETTTGFSGPVDLTVFKLP